MGEKTRIKWTDKTWNPWIGCTKISEGCAHCYAEKNIAAVRRRGGKVLWGPGMPRARTKGWDQVRRWNRTAQKKGTLIKVFPSLCDVFDSDPEQEKTLDGWRQDLFDLIKETPALSWLLLTKRPEVAALPRWAEQIAQFGPKVWLGTSVENQKTADRRLPILVEQIPSKNKFVSAEPLLGAVDLSPWLADVKWVIVGGESKKNARRMELDWARSIRKQCASAGVKFFFKQVGGSDAKNGGNLLDGEAIEEEPDSLTR